MRPVAGVLFLLAAWMALPRGEVHSLGRALSLETLVDQSALVARVRVIGTRPELGELSSYRSIATIEILESFRGPPAGEVVALRFDNGLECPNVRYAAGEVCLLFAGLDIDGTYFTVNTENGKKPVSTRDYTVLVKRIRELCAERTVSAAGPPEAGDLEVSLKTNAAPQEMLDAGSVKLRVEIENLGAGPIAVADELRIEVRQELGILRVARPEREEREVRRDQVTLIVKAGDGVRFREEMKLLSQVRGFFLEPGQVRIAEFTAAELWPGASGRGTLSIWARAGRDLVGPLRFAVDFGDQASLRESEIRKLRPGEFRPSGPAFRELSASEQISRFLARNGAALSTIALAAAVLALLLVLRKGIIGRRRTFRRGRDLTCG